MNNKGKMSWFNDENKKKIFRVMLILSTIAFVLSVFNILINFSRINGTKKIFMCLAPAIFAYFIYMYYTRIKQLNK
jgi:hypothetical protein